MTFFAGNTSQILSIILVDDSVLEPTEQFEVEIKAIHLIEGEPIPSVLIGPNNVTTGIILDDDGKLLTCIFLLNNILNWYHCRSHCDV